MRRGSGAIELVCVAALAAAGTATGAPSSQPLRTAIYLNPDSPLFSGPSAGAAFDRIRRTGATSVRILLSWNQVAPATRPADWDPTNPGDSNYRWDYYDAVIRNAAQKRLEPLVTILSAPFWAQPGPPAPPPNSFRPDPV